MSEEPFPRIRLFSVAPYAKAVVAVVTAISVIGATVVEAVADGVIDTYDIIQVLTVIGGAFGVYQVKNA